MATFTKINDFVEDLCNGVHNFGANTFRAALSNTAPASETSDPTADGNGVLANVTEIAYTNLSGGAAPALASASVSLSSGTVTVDFGDVTFTASGGALPTFRYIYIYNDTATGDALVCVFDAGEAITLADGESRTLQLNASGLFTVA